MRTLDTGYIIFTTWKTDVFQTQNEIVFHTAFKMLQESGLNPIQAHGVYLGQHEPSIILPRTQKAQRWVEYWADKSQQESILLMYGDRFAELLYMSDGLTQPLGYMKSYPTKRAGELKSYTQLNSMPDFVFSTEDI
jgi:hypothetical protein